MIWFWDNAVTLANLVMAAAAIAALIYAHLQIAENEQSRAPRQCQRIVARDAAARLRQSETFRSDAETRANSTTTSAPSTAASSSFQKYELYVDTILNASEEILEVSPTKEWDVCCPHSAQAASRLSAVALLSEVRLP